MQGPCQCNSVRHGVSPQQQQARLLLPRHTRRRWKGPSRLLAGADSRNGSSSRSSSSSSGGGGSSSSSNNTPSQQQPQPAAASEANSKLHDILSDAKQELYQSLQELKDTAGIAFVPGYQPAAAAASSSSSGQRQRSKLSSSGRGKRKVPRFTTYGRFREVALAKQQAKEEQQQQQQRPEVESIPQRLQQLLTGQFVRKLEGRVGGNANHQLDARLAAMQFELGGQMLDAAQQQQQQQQQAKSAAAPTDQVIDMLPDSAAVGGQQSSYEAAMAAAAAAADFTDPAAAARSAAAAAAEVDKAADEPYPAVTNMLVLAMWMVFVLQWWPALPELWLTVKKVGIVQGLVAVLLAYPDTPVTQALQLDFSAVQKGNLTGLITSGLLHSGLAATWLCTRALRSCGTWLEIGLGGVQLLSIFLIAIVCASLAHVVAGRSLVAVCGSGAVIGVCTTWTLLARRFLQRKLPMWTVYFQLGSLVALNLSLGLLQPAVGVASVVGGMIGGAVAVKLAVPVANALQWLVTLPVLASLFVVKLLLDAAKGVMAAVLMGAVFVSQFVSGLVQTVRRV